MSSSGLLTVCLCPVTRFEPGVPVLAPGGKTLPGWFDAAMLSILLEIILPAASLVNYACQADEGRAPIVLCFSQRRAGGTEGRRAAV